MSEGEVTWASYSALAQHRECPQRWNYSKIRRLEKLPYADDVKVELEFGSWAHMLRAAEALTRGRAHSTLKSIPDKLTCVDYGPELAAEGATIGQVFALAEEWWKKQPSLVKDVWIERIGEGLPERLVALYERWVMQWKEEIRDERPVAVEMKWTRRLPMPAGSGAGVELIGYVDEIYRDVRRNVLVVRDNKFHKRLGTQSSADDMMDSQLQIYAWGASPLVRSWGIGPIQATAYDRARMVKPATPVVTAGGTLSKSVTDYDLQTYRQWALGPAMEGVPWGTEGVYYVSGKRAGEPKFGHYHEEEAVVERLSSPQAISSWFQRTLVPLNKNLIRAHLQACIDSAMDIERTRARVATTQMAGRNLGNCRWCDFQKLCRAEMFGGVDGTYDLGDLGLRQR